MAQTIQLRRDTAANWTATNPVLAQGEIGLETDTLAYKIGNGIAAWNALAYRDLSGEFQSLLLEVFTGANEPSNPAAGRMLLYGKNMAGRMVPKFKGPGGLDTPLQPALWANGRIEVHPSSGTGFTTVAAAAPTAVGTVSHPGIASGSLRAQTRRAIVTSAATANSASELRIAANIVFRGDAVGQGGFHFACRWGLSSAVAGQRAAVGLFGTTAAIATTQSPSSLTNVIMLANDAADANMQVMHNDGAGNCTRIDLGVNFPVPSSVNNAMYEVQFFALPNALEVGYRVLRLDTGAVVTGTIAADLPAPGQFLTWHAYVNNNNVAAAVILDFYRLYVETDY
jgi:Major tropism determinant N-terminal domain